MRFDLTVGLRVIPFTPVMGGGQYPFVLSVGTARITARAGTPTGFGATETPNAQVTLDNGGKKLVDLIGNPMRAAGILYDDDGALAFAGFVSLISYGRAVVFTLES